MYVSIQIASFGVALNCQFLLGLVAKSQMLFFEGLKSLSRDITVQLCVDISFVFSMEFGYQLYLDKGISLWFVDYRLIDQNGSFIKSEKVRRNLSQNRHQEDLLSTEMNLLQKNVGN